MSELHGMSTKEIQQNFLDENQYSESNIHHYETIFGKQFVSTGGKETTKVFTEKLNLKPNEYVLDFGSGLGGSSCFMAALYKVKVLGIDVSKNMISAANKYLSEMDKDIQRNVEFRLSDGTVENFPENSFDCIYTRETLVHIEGKESLLQNFYKWLKPGGRLLLSEYGLGNKNDRSEEFINYVNSRGYYMTTVSDFEILLKRVGFKSVVASDLTSDCIKILKKDAELLYKNKSTILDSITRCDYDRIVSSWDRKLLFCVNGDQSWGLFTVKK